MQKRLKQKIRKIFKDVKIKRVILFKNPNEFKHLYIERVNPNHIGIIWGKRHKKFNKGTHYIKCGKIYFSVLPVAFGFNVLAWFDAFTNYIYNLLLTVGILTIFVCCITSILIYWLPFKLYAWRLTYAHT